MSLSFKSVQDARFQRAVYPYLEYGFNLALSLLQNRSDAEDALQEASVKAYQSVSQLRGEDSKPWFLRIVRNECMNALRKRSRAKDRELSFDDDLGGVEATSVDPCDWVQSGYTREKLRQAIDGLPLGLRETLMLREIEGLSYQEIATVTDSPIGTVMSRLSRARASVAEALSKEELGL